MFFCTLQKNACTKLKFLSLFGVTGTKVQDFNQKKTQCELARTRNYDFLTWWWPRVCCCSSRWSPRSASSRTWSRLPAREKAKERIDSEFQWFRCVMGKIWLKIKNSKFDPTYPSISKMFCTCNNQREYIFSLVITVLAPYCLPATMNVFIVHAQ